MQHTRSQLIALDVEPNVSAASDWQRPNPTHPASAELDLRDARILVVDTHVGATDTVEAILRAAGYTAITTTEHLLEACALHADAPFDLILASLHLAEVDSFRLARSVNSMGEDSCFAVILPTCESCHTLRAVQAGARDFISRPLDKSEVTTRAHNLLETRHCRNKIQQLIASREAAIIERTQELALSEYRFRSLTALTSDWYWEQNETGDFTTVSGPVFEMLGIRMTAFLGKVTNNEITGWNETERQLLQARIAKREPFLDFAFSRTDGNGLKHHYRVSGEPMFDPSCRFTGYRGIGAEILAKESVRPKNSHAARTPL